MNAVGLQVHLRLTNPKKTAQGSAQKRVRSGRSGRSGRSSRIPGRIRRGTRAAPLGTPFTAQHKPWMTTPHRTRRVRIAVPGRTRVPCRARTSDRTSGVPSAPSAPGAHRTARLRNRQRQEM